MRIARWPHLFYRRASFDPQLPQYSRAVDRSRSCASQLLPYGIACVMTMAPLLLRYEQPHLLTDNLLPLMLEFAVVVSAWYGGLGVGFFATGLAALVIHQAFVPPYFTFALASLRDGLLLVLMASVGVGSSLLIEYLHQARRCAAAEAIAHQGAADELIALNQTLHERLHDVQTLLLLLELSCEPICIWDLDRGIVEWNRGCEELYGISKAEALGQVIYVLLKTRFPVPLAEYQRILARDGQWSGELWHTTHAGREVLVEGYHRLLEIDGRRLVLQSHRDITAHRQAERALLQAYAELAQRGQEPAAPLARKIA